jgi:hypothetical protein
MDWQLLIVLVVVSVAGAYVARATWRTWRGAKSGCGGGCACPGGKAASPAGDARGNLISPEQVTLRHQSTDST